MYTRWRLYILAVFLVIIGVLLFGCRIWRKRGHQLSWLREVLLILGVVIMPALFEELLFRGVLYGSLRYLMDKHAAVALTAGIFTLVHPQYEWQLQLLYLLPMAVFDVFSAVPQAAAAWRGVRAGAERIHALLPARVTSPA